MKTKNIITILTALPLMAGFMACSSDTESEAYSSKEQLIVEEGSEIVMLGQEESAVMNITADCGWRVEQDITNSNFDDLAIRPMSGSGSATLSIKATKNPGVQVRTSYVTIVSDGGLKRKVKIRQRSGNENVEITESSLGYASAGTPLTSSFFNINSNISWNITVPAAATWVHLDKTSANIPAGSSVVNSTINVSVDPLASDAARTTRLIISFGSSTSYYVTVRQDGLGNVNLSVSSKELSFYTNWASGEKDYYPTEEAQTVNIASNAYWKVVVPSTAKEWLKVDPMEGTGNSTVKVICPPYSEYGKTRYTMFFVVAGLENPIMEDIFVQQTASQYVEPNSSSSEPYNEQEPYDPNRP